MVRKLLLGSHVETQPHAGWLDGALGVIYGLEVARTLGGGIDVAAWADEEGHFGSFIGSRSFCGLLPEAEIDACRNREGTVVARCVAAGRASPAGHAPWSIRRVIAATWRRISSRAPNWRTPASASASSPPSSAAIASASCSRACRTTPAPRAWRSARMPALRWCILAAAIYRRFPDSGRTAHGVDHGAHHARSRRAEYRAGPRGDAVPVPRHRSRDAGDSLSSELEALVAEATRGPCDGDDRRARADRCRRRWTPAFQDALERAAERHAPGCMCACRVARAMTRRSWRSG